MPWTRSEGGLGEGSAEAKVSALVSDISTLASRTRPTKAVLDRIEFDALHIWFTDSVRGRGPEGCLVSILVPRV